MQRAGLFELHAVVALSTHRNFRAAAAELGMSPSALSHAVASLERRMGVRLFHRTTRSVALSAAGEQFLARVRPALREISMAMESANAFRDTPTGTLRINTATSEGAARLIFAPIMLKFLRRYPDMHLDIVSEGRLADIVAEGFDAGVRLMEAVPQDMIAVPCSPALSFAVVGSPRYFRKHAPPKVPADLAAHNCIRSRFASGAIFRWEFEKRRKAIALDVKGSLTLDHSQLKIAAALNGVGLAYVNEWDVAGDIKTGRLIRVLEDWTPRFPGLALYYPGHRYVPAGLRALIAVIREINL